MSDSLPPSKGGPIMVCAVCARVLDAHNKDGQLIGYAHAWHSPAEDDHVAVPVPQDQVHVRGLCDFCGDDSPAWRVPVRTYGYAVGAQDEDGRIEDLGLPMQTMVGDWAACGRCAGYISRDDWDVLARYSARRAISRRGMVPGFTEQEYRDFVARSLMDYWKLTRDNMTGPPEPFTWPEPAR